MQYKFGKRSKKNMHKVHPSLIGVMHRAIRSTPLDFTILSGFRTAEEQNELYRKGFSKKDGYNRLSKHQGIYFPASGEELSLAIDIAPYPVDWNDLPRFYVLAGVILGAAKWMEVNIRWGGNWDMDNDLKDNTFMDLGHFELMPPYPELGATPNATSS